MRPGIACDLSTLDEGKNPLTHFRSLRLPPGITGRLFLHSMPGREEPWSEFVAAAKMLGVQKIFSLVSGDEAKRKSPEYARAINSGSLTFQLECFPIVDFNVPDDMTSFRRFVAGIASQLSSGCIGLLHCGAGLGRTGMVATCVLLEFGVDLEEAFVTVRLAGSGSETNDQIKIVEEYAAEGT